MTEGHTPDLIERIEAADADRLLDAEIHSAVLSELDFVVHARPAPSRNGRVVVHYQGSTHGTRQSPSYTASIDAAMTLIEGELSGLELTADDTGRWQCVISTHLADGEGYGATPALAIISASLKARAIP